MVMWRVIFSTLITPYSLNLTCIIRTIFLYTNTTIATSTRTPIATSALVAIFSFHFSMSRKISLSFPRLPSLYTFTITCSMTIPTLSSRPTIRTRHIRTISKEIIPIASSLTNITHKRTTTCRTLCSNFNRP